ncbi:MAG: glycosyl transferase family 2, partial [Alphaproteobacteria bacterium]
DTALAPEWVKAAGQFVQDIGPMGAGAAYFHFALDDRARAARRLERMVQLRNAVFGLPYGDQGLLIPRNFYENLEGYSEVSLMEDVALVRKIGKRRLQRLEATAQTSAHRYQAHGYLRQSASNLWTLMRYMAGADPDKLAARYHRTAAP